MDLFGRRKIYTTITDFNEDNILTELNLWLDIHCQNMLEMEFLYWFRRGLQPILERKKNIRPEINNKVVENHAAEIVAFKNGYFLTQPAFYVSRREDKEVNDKVKRLNEYLYLSGKQQADNEIVDWFHTVGLGNVYMTPYADEECPVRAYALDPRTSFVVYSRSPGNEPAAGVNVSLTGNGEGESTKVTFDVYTKNKVFRIAGGITGSVITGTPIIATATSILEQDPNAVGEIPIIEYQYENNRMGAFEPVVSLLDTINKVQSNRIDGIEQFIQSLMIFYNCQLGEDEDGNKVTPAYIREAGAIFLKSIGMDKADLKILSEQLDQSQTQVLIDYLYEKMLTIVGMPATTKGGSSTSDTGAAVLFRDGWYQADTFARCTEDLFKASNRRFDRVFIKILNAKTDLDIKLSDFELQFVRNETANILVKTQAALNLKELGFSPELAFAKSGVSNDPVADVENSRKYIDMKWTANDNVELIDEQRTDSFAPEI